MLGSVLFWLGFFIAFAIGFLYFRDLGDLSQLVIRVKRENVMRFMRNEYQLLAVGLVGAVVMVLAHLGLGGGPAWLFWIALPVLALFYAFPWMWVHVLLRNQQNSAKYYSIEEARELVSPSSSVLVIENNGVARAHPDTQIWRPHIAGNDEGLDGEEVVMTYCGMANLGMGYKPVIEGKKVDLEVMAQHGNNLILRDNVTGEPIQHIYGYRERDGKDGPAMQPWPTFRMSFRGFQKAYPEGTVFLNKPASNLVLRFLDFATETVFSVTIPQQHRQAKPLVDNLSHYDDRLPNKTYIWGINIGEDAVCYTDDFIEDNKGLINAVIGGQSIVIAYDPKYESVGAYYNESREPVTQIDFFGNSDRGLLQRVETLKSGMFWHVWVEFFPHTDINRVGDLGRSNIEASNSLDVIAEATMP